MIIRMMLALLCAMALPAHAQTVRYIHTDGLGSVVAVTDASRNVIERREYEPFGAQLTPAIQDGPGYTGHVQDAATGLTYMQQRYYDPRIGTFLSVDPVPALSSPEVHFNRYRYANNNPYRFTDPDGRRSCPTGTRICPREALSQVKSAVIGYVAQRTVAFGKALVSETKKAVIDHLQNNTYSAQAGVSGTIAAPIRDKSPLGGSVGATGAINLSVNNHGQISLTASGAPLVGQGGGATAGVTYGLAKSEGGRSRTGFTTSTNHHAEAAFSVRPYPVSFGGSYDWSSHGAGFSAASARFSAGEIMFAGGGEQVNLTYTFNDGIPND